jgi:hypothetical protein
MKDWLTRLWVVPLGCLAALVQLVVGWLGWL